MDSVPINAAKQEAAKVTVASGEDADTELKFVHIVS